MVATWIWAQPWPIILLSAAVLCLLLLMLLNCSNCFDRPHSQVAGGTQFNYFDRIRKASSCTDMATNVFRRFSKDGELFQSQSQFTSDALPICPVARVRDGKTSELVESGDSADNRFASLKLKIEDQCNDDKDDMMSCHSADSKYTFHSTYPPMMLRATSTTEYVSLEFQRY